MGYYDNCQTCTVAYELRRRGFNVEAMSNKDNEFYEKWCVQNRFDWQDRFLTEDGKRANYKRSMTIKDTGLAKLKFIEDQTAVQGRYEIYCAWKGRKDGHVFIVERQKTATCCGMTRRMAAVEDGWTSMITISTKCNMTK